MLDQTFQLAAGTTIGRDHTFSRRCNQDAYQFASTKDLLVGIVCDGCGDPTSPHSEVGAQLGARLITSTLLSVPKVDPGWLEIARHHTVSSLEVLAHDLCGQFFSKARADDPRPKDYQIIKDYFLFTVIGFAVTPEKAWFFSIGDGFIWVNGQQTKIGPFPDNEPPYMAYSLLDTSLLKKDPGCLKFQIREEIPTVNLHSFLIGTDGLRDFLDAETELHPNGKEHVGNIAQFWTDDRYFSNQDRINRKLCLVNRDHTRHGSAGDGQTEVSYGHLHDDTTLIVGRRVREEDL